MLIKKLPIVILVSGNGSNLQAIIDAISQGLPVEIRAVISNQRHALALEKALRAHIPVHVIPHDEYPDRQSFENALSTKIDEYQPQIVALAGFMRRLTSSFVQHYWGKLINIHPSLLPKHPGLHTHRKALAAVDEFHGATIHFVTDEVDQGPIICQAKLPILQNDNETSLKKGF